MQTISHKLLAIKANLKICLIDKQREILAINRYEGNWKIKTNINKFTPIHLGARITIPLNIDDDLIEFNNYGKCLGLTITSAGYYKHLEERKKKHRISST